ncbi:MAG: hypothetical protein IPJ38_13540 [Dechloromonas sp.]|uniref:Type I restriction modification DNA specificity domain-containing protein n=1 Tax=Candidatus Dechloromonas phosphorivorans TaxID=2899244 RepID=A0A935KAV3_9RHOO|nr:hypothetical protein [Candidatus Dechloromonas phosphorivorans]
MASIEKGVTYSKADQVRDETSNVVLTADNISLDGKFEISKRIFLRESLSVSPSKQLGEGDIFICLSSGSRNHVGKVAFIDRETKCYAGGFMGIVRAKAGLLQKCCLKFLIGLKSEMQSRAKALGQIFKTSQLDCQRKIPNPQLMYSNKSSPNAKPSIKR